MNQDQARRVAEEGERDFLDELDRVLVNADEARTDEQIISAAHRLVRAALVKLTQGQEPVAMWVNQEQAFQAMVPTSTIQEGTLLYSALPIPSQQEERVRELESVLDVVLNQLKKWQANGGVKSGYEFIDVAITVIDAARSKEQGK